MKIEIKKLDNFGDLELPHFATALAAGADLRAALDAPVTLCPGERLVIPTGLAVSLPCGYEAQIRPRSGLASKQGITCLNSPGTIDADYTGEVGVLLINHGREDVVIERGDRIAQIVFAKIHQPIFEIVEELSKTDRGSGGFGSTGVN